MADKIPVKAIYSGSDVSSLGEYVSGDTIAASYINGVPTGTLPLVGGAMTGAITTNSTFDTRDVATDGTKLDGIASGAEVNTANTAITTSDQSWTGSQRATTVVDNDGSFDMNGGNNFKCTPAGNFTLTFTNITNGQTGFILLVNSGGHTVSAHANSKVDANLLATVTAAGTYLMSYFSDGTNVYLTNSAIYT